MPFPGPLNHQSTNCLSSTNIGATSTQPYYVPDDNLTGGGLESFSKHEHYMTRVSDEQFGLCINRFQQPLDFAGREAHVHFDVDMDNAFRRYVRVMLSPDLARALSDDRHSDRSAPLNSFDLWFRDGRFIGHVVRTGVQVDGFDPNGVTYHGVKDVRDSVDLYVTRTHIRVLINGVTYIDQVVADLGFDRAYLYLSQASYNPCKGFEDFGLPLSECQPAAQVSHWDNVAFDGLVLPLNGLTPAGQQDVIGNVYGATACSVKGFPAMEQASLDDGYTWHTWGARMPVQPVAASDWHCTGGSTFWRFDGNVRAMEVVTR